MPRLSRRAILRGMLIGFVGAPIGASLLACSQSPTATANRSGQTGAANSAASPTASPTMPATVVIPSPTLVMLPSPDPLIPGQASSATQRSNEPFRYQVSAVKASAPVSSYARAVSHIVLVRVTHLLPLRWETIDGARPANPLGAGALIFTPVGIEVEQVLRGEAFIAGYIKALGGRIGSDEVVITPRSEYTYRVDEQAVVFLAPTRQAPEQIGGFPVFDIGGKFVFAPDGRIRDVYPTKPFGSDYELLTWPEFLAAITPPFPPIATPTR